MLLILYYLKKISQIIYIDASSLDKILHKQIIAKNIILFCDRINSFNLFFYVCINKTVLNNFS